MLIVGSHYGLFPCTHVDLRAATNISAIVVRLDPLKVKVKVKWSHQRVNNAPLPTEFMVVAESGITQIKRVENRHTREATLKLRYGTTYTLKVITIYGQTAKLKSEKMEFTTPSEDEGLCHYIGLECSRHILASFSGCSPPSARM